MKENVPDVAFPLPASRTSSVWINARTHHGQVSTHTTSTGSSRLLFSSTPSRPRSCPTPARRRRAVRGGTGSLDGGTARGEG